jgi:hypothetical protein
MGRFDALTQLEEPKKSSRPSPVVAIPVNTQQSTVVKDQSSEPKKPTKPQTRLPTKEPATLDSLEKPEKYTTHLEPSLVKKLKLHATERDMKDYQVIKKALLLYFEKSEKGK